MPADANYISGSNMVSVDDAVSMIPEVADVTSAATRPEIFGFSRDAAYGGVFCA